MKRPVPGDCNEYFFGYASQVEDDDVLGALERQLEETTGRLSALSDERALFRYAPEKWSVKEVVGHLIDSERIFACRALWFARSAPQPLPGFDENEYVAASDFDARPLAELVEELRTVRAATLSLFRGLNETELERTGTANDALFRCRSIPWILAGHELHHRGVLGARYGI